MKFPHILRFLFTSSPSNIIPIKFLCVILGYALILPKEIFLILEVGNDEDGRFHPVLRNCRLDLNGTNLLIIYENTTHSVSYCVFNCLYKSQQVAVSCFCLF